MVTFWAANTDLDWFDFLSSQPNIDEVNFWQPSGATHFRAVAPGALFLFKLKSPRNVIGGFGIFHYASNVPISLAWEAFGIKNGTRTFDEMRTRIGKLRRDPSPLTDYTIGCRVVVEPVFFPKELWVDAPRSWSREIVVGKRFDTQESEGLHLWEKVVEAGRLARQVQTGRPPALSERQSTYGAAERFGAPALIRPRLGQGAFRIAVTDNYQRSCAISQGRVLPALDAAHIQPYAEGGEHDVSNGILLRRDIHSVFDAGYVTFDRDYRLVVSDRVRTDFNNGNEYRQRHGDRLQLPADPALWPSQSKLDWHREYRFKG